MVTSSHQSSHSYCTTLRNLIVKLSKHKFLFITINVRQMEKQRTLGCCSKWRWKKRKTERNTKVFQTIRQKLVFLWKLLHYPHANCQRIKVAWFDVNEFNLVFLNYRKCHNHRETTTDDLARTNVWHVYLYTLCSAALSFLLCLWHITPHLLLIIILPLTFCASSLSF